MKTRAVFLAALLAGCGLPLLPGQEPLQPLHGKCTIAAADKADRIRFKLEEDDCREDGGRCDHNDNDMPASDFSGFSLADLRRDGAHVEAKIIGEPGTLTCSGTVENLILSGESTFVADRGFAARMLQMGFTALTSRMLEAYTLFHVQMAWIQGLESAGVTGIDSEKIVALRIFKVDEAYARSMTSLGYPKLSADKLVAFRIHGVNAEEVREYRALGYEPTADELIQMRIFNVTPDFIQRMKSRGLGDLTIGKLVQVRIFKLAE